MFNKDRDIKHKLYIKAHNYFSNNPQLIIKLEKHISDYIENIISSNKDEIREDYNEASYLYPFWQNYPPDDRGRQPKGDQFPWLEVGEHTLGAKLPRFINKDFEIRDYSLPVGPDERFVLTSQKIKSLTEGFTDSCWLFVDIKSVGPRDDQEHTVMSHNQVSGDGRWEVQDTGIINQSILAKGKKASHEFYCSIPPLYILSNGKTVPVVQIVLKPVYGMLRLDNENNDDGQPLKRIDIITIPNGILLTINPNYLEKYPELFFPGKDDKSKNPRKVRARISFNLLRAIDDWRVKKIYF